ncbi:MAG TPA: dTDP-4-dehydrorhamnose reductase [Clostridia bacterium]|nr:dTDP-4-dehydrorhamnose reductase [Clostridia bacterium]
MKILVTGAKGQLGSEIIKVLIAKGYDCIGTDIGDFDITDEDASRRFIVGYYPEIVIHCAGYTQVDNAEENTELCMNVNYYGTKNIAAICKDLGSKLVYITTDYVFDGEKQMPYDVFDEANPLNVYGMSKYLGEKVIREQLMKYFIIRVSWMFGHSQNNFVQKILNLAKINNKISVINDQVGSPTYSCDVAKLIVEVGFTEKYGIYHATNEGYCTWAEFAKEIIRQVGLKCEINEVKSYEYSSKAKRPTNSRLSKKSLTENGFTLLPTWQNALNRYLEKENVRCGN